MHDNQKREPHTWQGRSSHAFEGLRQDLRLAFRQLRKSPAFAWTAILVFALGIGASTSIFVFVDAALVRPLPYHEPPRLVGLFERLPIGDRYHLSYGDYLDWKNSNHAFTSLDIYRPDRFVLKAASSTEEVAGARVSDGFFRTLGVTPFLGRDFRSGEDLSGAPRTVILSYQTWQKRFSGNPSVLGQSVTLDGKPSLIVGVLPSNFHFAPVEPAGFWLVVHEYESGPRLEHPYYGVARLRSDTSIASASANLELIAQQIALAFPHSNRDRGATVLPLTDLIVGNIRPTLVALLCGAGLLSLMGFVNVSSLLLVRAEGRRRELAVRCALGASRATLTRQLCVEGFLPAVCGCVLGLVLSGSTIGSLTRQIPRELLDNMPYLQGLHFNLHLVLFAMALSMAGGILVSVGPILQLLRSDLQHGLTEGGRTAAGRGWRQTGSTLVAVELGITVVLLMSAGLLAKSFYRLLHEDLGMATDHLAVLHVLDQDATTEVQSTATERNVRYVIASLPGTKAVGTSNEPALASGEGYAHTFQHFRVVGRSYPGEGDEATIHSISIGYFETLQARLLQGRYFNDEDDALKLRVAVINHTMAAQFFPGEDPIGKHIVSEYGKEYPIQIIGVADDIKDGPLDSKTTAAVYLPLSQAPTDDFYVTVRTSSSTEAMLPSVVSAVRHISSGLVVDGEDTMADRINNSQSAYLHRSAAWLVAGFATLALILGTVGLYGVISYSVGQRRREIGVRMALGAQRSSVYQLVLKEACWHATLGIGGGVFCSFLVNGLLRNLLFGVSPWDAETLLVVIAVLFTAALVASFAPARYAASINPTEALRAE